MTGQQIQVGKAILSIQISCGQELIIKDSGLGAN